MRFISAFSQAWLRRLSPIFKGHVTRLIYGAHNATFGRGFRVDGIPRCLLDKDATLVIRDNVEFRSGVELRVHGKARLIIEEGVRIDRGVRLLATNTAEIRIGHGTRIGLYAVLNGGDSITVGEKCLISGFVYLQTSMHRFSQEDVSIRDQGYDHAPIIIGDGAWLAAHVVVMPGVVVGNDSIVGSNAVVTHNVPPGQLVGGIPAKKIRDRTGVQA